MSSFMLLSCRLVLIRHVDSVVVSVDRLSVGGHGEKAQHVRWGVDKNELVVVFNHYGPLRCRVHVVEKDKIFLGLYWLARWIFEEKFDVYGELTPAYLMHLERRFMYRVNRIREGGIQLEFYFANEPWNVFSVFAANVATPSIHLVLRHFLTSVHGVCAKDDRFVNHVMLLLVSLHYARLDELLWMIAVVLSLLDDDLGDAATAPLRQRTGVQHYLVLHIAYFKSNLIIISKASSFSK